MLCEAVALIIMKLFSAKCGLIPGWWPNCIDACSISEAAVKADIRYESKTATNQNRPRPFNDVMPHAHQYIHAANGLMCLLLYLLYSKMPLKFCSPLKILCETLVLLLLSSAKCCLLLLSSAELFPLFGLVAKLFHAGCFKYFF